MERPLSKDYLAYLQVWESAVGAVASTIMTCNTADEGCIGTQTPNGLVD